MRNKLLVALALLLAATVIIEEHRVHAQRARAATTALHASNLAAERDSTRNVALENRQVGAQLGDSLRVVERRVLQMTQRGDALDRALGRERVARYMLSARIDSLRASALAVADSGLGHEVRRARFDVRQAPYTVAAEVEMPPRPDTARLSLRVVLDPIHVEARVSCSAADEHGIRTASIVAAAPRWARVAFDQVEQAPELCASPALAGERRKRHGLKVLPVVGIGRIMPAAGLGSWGFFVGLALSTSG